MAEWCGRGSLLVRLLALSVVISILSISATAWLAVRDTTRALQQERGRALADDARIYSALLGYAATHHDWTGVSPLVRSLAADTERRIVLTDRDRTPLAASGAGALPQRASATVDPLDVDTELAGTAGTGGIDARATGPYQLPEAERTALRRLAVRALDCLHGPVDPAPMTAAEGLLPVRADDAEIVVAASGRPRIASRGTTVTSDIRCAGEFDALAEPTATERQALDQLDDLVNTCLARQRIPAVRTDLDGQWTPAGSGLVTTERRDDVDGCVAAARRTQIADHVAPPVLLFVTDPGTPVPVGAFDLTPANRLRIFGVAGVVLLVAVGVTVLVGVRLVRPLHALTAAAGRMRNGDTAARVRVAGRDEIARLGNAFNEMAEQRCRVEQLRRDMVGDIAHEMRTPVTNIRGWLEAAEDGVVELDVDLASSLLDEALLLQHVIDDLQDLAAADAGELKLHRQQVEVPRLLREVADAFAPAAESAGVALVVDAAPGTLDADPIRLRQAIGNLITNAIRHTPADGQVTLSARHRAAYAEIVVADTGPGIPEEQRDLVFERFWRAEKSRNRRTGGSGLGLAIVRKIAESHGGSAAVSGAAGTGAVFTLRLPAASGQADPPHGPAPLSDRP
ncbi:cell wall metabolism sensor histidine kinase WalK [Micromonospora sp. HUAS LYJ1]|uniref:sensor histidine kinase n=1 Tax=Micromonospora sp. HUAS LYJ1 TaxID=3061626 RepID=UPI00267323DC|nr:HAMP domain-containing sensor histidine kinase [Micromonospora sp. HUAS LYJ1]WKU07101.1 HAMP domain-containing sensor histidine kinase [Micromonospora sp. HUAS LYJ1]